MLLVQVVFVVFTAFATHIVGANIVRPIFFLFFFSLLKRKKEAKKEKLSPTLTCAAVYRTKGSVLLLIKLYLSFSLYNRYWKPMLLKG